MQKEIETFLQKTILPELEVKGRPNWDKPHTILVVEKLKEILEANPSLKVNRIILIIAAYAHDWGYADIFHNKSKLTYSEIIDAKAEHMKIGAEKLKNILENSVFDGLTQEQKERAIHLVAVHDKLKELKDTDEIILMEADTLAQLDVTKIKPTLTQNENDIYIRKLKEKRLANFITEHSKKEGERLIELRKEYY